MYRSNGAERAHVLIPVSFIESYVMSARHRLFAITATVLLGLSALSTGALAATAVAEELSVDVTQNDGVTVAVTDNGSAVENASVTVEAVNNTTYAGTGNYTTDVNGTVGLPTPEENATVSVTAAVDDASASTTAELEAGANVSDNETDRPETFGQRVALLVHGLIATTDYDGDDTTDGENETDDDERTVGQMISEFATANNPGADEGPEHAGPPENKGPDSDDGEESDDDRRGPPENKGPGSDDDDDDSDDGESDT